MLKSQKERKSPRSIEFSESVQVKLQKKGMFEEIVLIQFWSGGAGESHQSCQESKQIHSE